MLRPTPSRQFGPFASTNCTTTSTVSPVTPVAMAVDGPTVFRYAGTEDAAGEAAGVVREVLAQQQLSAELHADRWHPLEEAWEDGERPDAGYCRAAAAEHAAPDGC